MPYKAITENFHETRSETTIDIKLKLSALLQLKNLVNTIIEYITVTAKKSFEQGTVFFTKRRMLKARAHN